MHKGNILPVQAHSRLMHWYRWQPFGIPLFNRVGRTALNLKYWLEPWMIDQKLKCYYMI